mgnify:CR=1 FL=1
MFELLKKKKEKFLNLICFLYEEDKETFKGWY